MEGDVLYHHGIKGQKWGIRRFQNKDGSLTAAGRKRRGEGDGDNGTNSSKDETPEETRSRLLKSTDAKEIYENRHLLTTNELNERINRIDTEQRLKSKIADEHAKTGADYLNKKMKGTAETVTNAKNLLKVLTRHTQLLQNRRLGKPSRKSLVWSRLRKNSIWMNSGKIVIKRLRRRLWMQTDGLRRKNPFGRKWRGGTRIKKQARKKTKNESRKGGMSNVFIEHGNPQILRRISRSSYAGQNTD